MADAAVKCPELGPEGQPCQKGIPGGWAVEEGHPGGHLWATDGLWAALLGGHYDSAALLRGEQVTIHEAENCPGPPECFGQATP